MTGPWEDPAEVTVRCGECGDVLPGQAAAVEHIDSLHGDPAAPARGIAVALLAVGAVTLVLLLAIGIAAAAAT